MITNCCSVTISIVVYLVDRTEHFFFREISVDFIMRLYSRYVRYEC